MNGWFFCKYIISTWYIGRNILFPVLMQSCIDERVTLECSSDLEHQYPSFKLILISLARPRPAPPPKYRFCSDYSYSASHGTMFFTQSCTWMQFYCSAWGNIYLWCYNPTFFSERFSLLKPADLFFWWMYCNSVMSCIAQFAKAKAIVSIIILITCRLSDHGWNFGSPLKKCVEYTSMRH